MQVSSPRTEKVVEVFLEREAAEGMIGEVEEDEGAGRGPAGEVKRSSSAGAS